MPGLDAAAGEGDGDDAAAGDETLEGMAAMADSSSQPIDDDLSDTSTVDMEEKDVEDWEERLWALARSYYFEYRGREKKLNVDNESVSSLLEIACIGGSIDDQSVKDQELLLVAAVEQVVTDVIRLIKVEHDQVMSAARLLKKHRVEFNILAEAV